MIQSFISNKICTYISKCFSIFKFVFPLNLIFIIIAPYILNIEKLFEQPIDLFVIFQQLNTALYFVQCFK